MHGGAAPQVQKAARLRLAELVDPAIDRLGKLVGDPHPGVALGAVKDVLDRTGHKSSDRLQVVRIEAEDLELLTDEELAIVIRATQILEAVRERRTGEGRIIAADRSVHRV